MSWNEYAKKLEEYKIDKSDFDFIKKAFDFATEAHEGQIRFSGDPYINHPVEVSLKIAALHLDASTIAAALLHDTVEDQKTTIKTIKKKFGDDVAFLVNGLTKVKKIKYRGIERQVESMRKMFLAFAEDIRVVVIKLMDRMHNMETLDAHPKNDKRLRIALETLEIFAPLADRLGMWNVKSHLEDLSFKYVFPEEYEWIAGELQKRVPERETYLKMLQPIVEKELQKENIGPFEVSYRAKSYYSLWKKLKRHEMDWDRIKDLMAVRIIVKDIEKCYATLGIIHKLWRPLPGKIKDYIALPKPNGYQSLHTTVFCVDGKVTEFQIRTAAMHREAEFGIAAHWAWEMAGKPTLGNPFQNRKFSWVRQLQEWQEELKNTKQSGAEILESLKIDFFKDRIFVLTPKGDVIDLPDGASPIDFAYHIHSEVGNNASGCKVNGKMVPLSHKLKSGEVVEIITQKNKKPSQEWLEFIKTSIARNRIRSILKKTSSLASPKNEVQKTEIIVTAKDRIGLIKDISAVFASFKISIEQIKSDSPYGEYHTINIVFMPKNAEQIDKIKLKLRKLEGLKEITARAKIKQ